MTTLPLIAPSNGKLDLAWDHDRDESTSITTAPPSQSRPYLNGSSIPNSGSPYIDLGLGSPIDFTMPTGQTDKIHDEDLRIKGLTVQEVLEDRNNGLLLNGAVEATGRDSEVNGDHAARTNGHVGSMDEEKTVIADSQFRPRKYMGRHLDHVVERLTISLLSPT